MRALALSILALALFACGGKHVEAPRNGAPAMLASIPADTPFVLAALEPIPLDVFAKYRDVVGPILRAQLAGLGTDPANKVFRAFLAELDGKWTAEGVESLGLSATPRFAFYMVGGTTVFRIELRDGDKTFATLQRITQRAGIPLPAPQTRAGRRYWRSSKGAEGIIAITAGELVVAISAHTGGIDPVLPILLGIEKPASNLAGGGPLLEARARHQLGGQILGLVDGKRLAAHVLGRSGIAMSGGCTAEIDRLAAQVPRFVLGYDISVTAMRGRAILELAADALAAVRSTQVELPGLSEALAARPALLIGGGADLVRGQAIAFAAAEAIRHAAATCGLPRAVEEIGELVDALAEPLPAPLSQLQGAVISILAMAFGDDLLPRSVEAFAIASASNAKALFEVVREGAEGMLRLEMPADGALHPIDTSQLPIPLPYPLFVGAADRALMVAVGAQGKRGAERILAAPRARAPLFLADFDYDWLQQLIARYGDDEDRRDPASGKLFRHGQIAVDLTDRGLELRFDADMK